MFFAVTAAGDDVEEPRVVQVTVREEGEADLPFLLASQVQLRPRRAKMAAQSLSSQGRQ